MPSSPICRLCGIMFVDPDTLTMHLRDRHQILPDEQTIVGNAVEDRPGGREPDLLADWHPEESLAVQR